MPGGVAISDLSFKKGECFFPTQHVEESLVNLPERFPLVDIFSYSETLPLIYSRFLCQGVGTARCLHVSDRIG